MFYRHSSILTYAERQFRQNCLPVYSKVYFCDLIVMRHMYSINFWRRLKSIDFLTNRSITTQCKHLIYGEDVILAKRNSQPIVALESTIITHGMPYPDNFNTALRVEDAVKQQGAVPATIGIIDGNIYVGLNHEQLEILSRTNSATTIKCSARDLSSIVSQKLNGGTTVSATMLIANLANIPIMATGGIGGVHRNVESTLDISTDLIELGCTPVAVVCSGVKSILDIAKTLEYLETQGVPVVKIGSDQNFPAFYSAETYDKLKAPLRVTNSREAADLVRIQRELNLHRGILLAVAVPKEHALNPNDVEIEISKALEKAEFMHIKGKNVTPFLLKELNETNGKFLETNVVLIENNAKIAAEIARYLCEGTETSALFQHSKHLPSFNRSPVVVGGAILDTILQVEDSEIKLDGRTHPGNNRQSCGGVGRNIADALIKLGARDTRFISVVGNDQPGIAIFESLKGGGGTLERSSNVKTARSTVVVDAKGECCFVVSEIDDFAAVDTNLIRKYQRQLEEASMIVIDANLPVKTMALTLEIASHAKVPVWYEPTDISKATKLFEIGSQWQDTLHFISPNKNELLAISRFLDIPVPDSNVLVELEDVKEIAKHLAKYVPVIISTMGSEGVLVTRGAQKTDPFYDENGVLIENDIVHSRLYPVLSDISQNHHDTVSVSGCGDCLVAGIIDGIRKSMNEESCITLALKAAALSLTSYEPVPSTLSSLYKVSKSY